MRRLRITLVCIAAFPVWLHVAHAATERTVILMLGGQYCDLYLGDVESALKKLAGIKAVDFKSMKGHAVVRVEGDTTTANQLVQAVNGVKGDGWHCSAQAMK